MALAISSFTAGENTALGHPSCLGDSIVGVAKGLKYWGGQAARRAVQG